MIDPRQLLLICTLAAVGPAAGCRCASRAGPGGTESSSDSTTAASGTTTGASAGQTVTSSAGSTGAPPDLPAGCQPELYGECDPWCQDCPEGQKCLPFANDGGSSWNATRCSPIAPDPKAPGEPCTAPEGPTAGVDDCEKGAMCWNVDPDTQSGTCSFLCSGSPNAPVCENLATFCNQVNGGILNLCVDWCSPLDQKGLECPSGSMCLVSGLEAALPVLSGLPFDPNTILFRCDLEPPYLTNQAKPCTYAAACGAGLACADATLVPGCDPNAAPGCCARWCDLSQPECPEGGTCQAVLLPHPDLPQEFADLGLCLLP